MGDGPMGKEEEWRGLSVDFPCGNRASGWDSGVERLDASYFEQDPVSCARGLIGCHLRWDGCEVRIVETEAYDAEGDEACHTWSRPSARDFVAQHGPGDAYVYLNYGMHWLFNLLVKGGPREGFVLLRAVEAIRGIEQMRERRGGCKDLLLGAGPARLTKALGVDGSSHGARFLKHRSRGIFRGDDPVECIAGPRIGISKAVELPWRFGDARSRSLSVKFNHG